MRDIKFETGKRYLIQGKSYSEYPPIFEVICMEISDTSYKLNFVNAKNIIWKDKKEFVKTPCGYAEYTIKEELQTIHDNQTK